MGLERILLLVVFFFVVVLPVVASGGPRVAVIERSVLARQVEAFGACLDVVPAACGESASTGGELGGDGSMLGDPVRQRILAVLDDGLAGLVAIVGGTRLARRHGRVVDQLKQVLSEAGDDGHLLAMLAQSVELVRVGGLDLLARDVGQLRLRDEGLGLGAHELLLENDNLGGVGLLVLQLSDLVRDLYLSCFPGQFEALQKHARWGGRGM